VLAVGPLALWGAPAVPEPGAAPIRGPVVAPPPDGHAPPVRLRVPRIGTDAVVVPVGVDERNEMAVPVDVRTVGWYRFGPEPGAAAGSSVLAGHVDDRLQGRGAFHRLRELVDGDVVQVELAGGRVLDHRVRNVVVVGKDELPVEQIFDRRGPPRLVLITCGGDFDEDAGRYPDNVAVTAEPAA
jgi:sortase (surface protein transpeptidase)